MNTILLGFACVLLGLATILASPIGKPPERQERSLKTSKEVKDFLDEEVGLWRSRLKRNANEADEDENDGNETGEDKNDENENDEDENDGNEDDGNENDGENDRSENDGNENDGNETGEDENDEGENDGNEDDGNENDEDETGEDENDEGENDGNEDDGNENDGENDRSENDGNENDGNETDEDENDEDETEWGTIDNDDETYRRERSTSKGGRRWKRTDLTYVFRNFTKDRPESETRREVQLAFKAWSDVTPLKFTETKFKNATIKLIFQDFNHTGRGPRHPYIIAVTSGGTITFDEHKNWNGPNLRLVAMHEIGHVLGLPDSRNRKSIMFYGYINSVTSLGPEDIERIQAIYGKPKKPSNSRSENSLSADAVNGILAPATTPWPAIHYSPRRLPSSRRPPGSKQTRGIY